MFVVMSSDKDLDFKTHMSYLLNFNIPKFISHFKRTITFLVHDNLVHNRRYLV